MSPFSFSVRKINASFIAAVTKSAFIILLLLIAFFQLTAQTIYTQDFSFSGALTSNGWTAHSGAGTNAISTTTGLTYTGYAGSGVGNAALISNLGGEDDNITFTSQSTNGSSVFAALLVNVTEAATSKSGDIFFHLGSPGGSTWTAFAARVSARVVSGNVNFGISNTGTTTYGTTNFSRNTTYLLVIKYTITTGTGNDAVSLWVLPSGLPASEALAGTAEVTNTATAGTDAISAIGLRQGSNSTSPTVVVDGIRIGSSWSGAVVPSAGATITGAATATAFTTTYGTASVAQNFSVSGSTLTADLVATAPTGFEVSTDGTNYGSTATFTQSSGSASGTLSIRLKANATVGGSYNAQNIVLSSTGATSVNITTASSGNNVNTKGLTITGIAANNKNYDGNTGATLSGTAAYAGLVNGESFSVSGIPTASFATAAAGNGKTVTVTGYSAPSSNYSLAQPSLTANINKVNLTITGITGANKQYDGNTTASFIGTAAYAGLAGGESFTVTGTPSASFADANIGSAKAITISGYTAPTANYTLTQPTLSGDITAKPLTISGLTADNKLYDGTTAATLSGTAVLNGVITADLGNVSLDGTPVATFASAAVGNNIVVTVTGYAISGTASGNYSLTQPTGLTANITSSSLQNQTITFDVLSNVTYGDADFALTGFASSGLTVSYVSSNTSVATVVGNTVTIVGAGSANITASQAGDGSYNPAVSVMRTLTVNPKVLTVSGASAQNKIYDGTTSASITGGTLNGVIGSDVVTITGGGSFASASVGTAIAVTASLTLAGAQRGNYTVTQPTGLSANIEQKELTIGGLGADNKYYDGNTLVSLSGTATLLGLITSDIGNVTLLEDFASAAFSSASAGNNIQVNLLDFYLDGAAASNYYLTLPTNITANILPLNLTVSGLTAGNKSYDGTIAATIIGTPSLSGMISGEASLVAISGTPSATFATANVGNNKVVTITGYSLTGSGASNYTISSPLTLTANITSAALTVTGITANNKVYDGNITATITGTPALSGVLTGDIGNVTLSGTGTATFADSAAGVAKVVNVTGYTISGTSIGNYTLIQPTVLSADITQATQTISFFPIPVKTTSDVTVTLTLNSSATLPIVYTSSNPAVATVSGNILTIVGAGTSTITASQSGNTNYAAALDVTQTLTVVPALAKWTFEGVTTSNSGTSASISVGSGVADQGILTSGTLFSATHASASTAWTNPAGNGSAKSVTANTWATGDYYQFKANTTGYKNILVYVDQTGSNTGPRDFKLQYSLNGTSYTDFGSVYALTNDSWSATISKTQSTRSFDISSITNLNNQGSVYFRVVCAGTSAISGTFASGGTNRIDNFLVSGLPCEATTSTTAATACNTYSWNGSTYTSSGTYTYTSRNSIGCDSFAILNLTINNSTNNTTTASACNTYTWNSNTYTASGTYTYNYTNGAGCASTDTLRLTINKGTFNKTTASACDSYTWNGNTYTISGTYTFNYNNTNGCASVDTLQLSITPSTTSTSSQTACDSYLWSANGATYATSGSYTAVVGCATQVLNLTIVASTSNTSSASVCDSYTWSLNGQTYTSSGSYTSVSGCVTRVLNLTITASTSNTTNASACDSYTWSVNGQTYTTAGTYSSVSGCHTEILNLTFTSSTTNSSTVTACDSYTWSTNGTTYNNSGSYTEVVGCATYILNLTIVASSSSSSSASACNSYTWLQNGVTYTSSGNYTSVTGCVTSILDLTIRNSNSSTETITACNTYTWHGTTYTSSNNSATWTGTNAAGCDSVVTLNLTIRYSTSSTETINACDSYTWHGTTYTASNNTATWTGTNAAGCDSVVTLNLTITPSSSNTTTQSVCDSYTWSVNGQTYTTSGSYTSITGCATKILNLTITASSSNTTTTTVCGSYLWNANGQTYTSSGSYTQVTGCNTEYLVLTVIPFVNNTTTVNNCDSYTWNVNGQTYTQSGTYTVAVTGTTPSGGAGGGVRISQVYPGGGGSTGTYLKDYVELYNSSCSPINISGWSIAYGSATGNFVSTAANGFTFPTGTTIGAKKYLLIECGAAGTAGASLPVTPDFITSTTGFSLSGTNGKLALFNTSITNVACSSLVASTVVDKISWGTGNCPEGTAKTTAPSVTQVMVRANAGETDTDNNNNDFVNTATSSAAPRNSSSSANSASPCIAACTNEILNLTITASSSNTITASACGSYSWSVNGQTYTSSGSYTSVSGCATTILNLTINNGTRNTSTVSACNSYVWNSNTYTSSGTYTYNYSNENGCASTDTLHLTILTSSFNSSTQSACNSYVWNGNTYTTSGTYTYSYNNGNGCASVDTLRLTIYNNSTEDTTAVSCNNFTWYGNTYTVSGNYNRILTAANGCDSIVTLHLTINDIPSLGAISGPTEVCSLVGATTPTIYSVTPIGGATAYNWVVPTGVVIQSGQGTNSLSVTFTSLLAANNQRISTTAVSAAGCTSNAVSILLSKTIPSIPTTITGPLNICSYVGQVTNVVYSCDSVGGATGYLWTAPSGCTIVSGQGTRTVSLSVSNTFTSGSVTVTAQSNCGNRASRSLTVGRTLPGIPVAISGPSSACTYIGTTTEVSYSIDPVANATSYLWTVPTGVSVVSGQGTNTLIVKFNQGFVSSSIKVRSVANCGSSADKSLAVSGANFSAPGPISGPTNACPFINNNSSVAVYTIRKVLNAPAYIWTVPIGATIVSHPGGTGLNDTIIQVSFNSSFVFGTSITVQTTGCGTSSARSITVGGVVPSTPGLISGPTNVCEYISSSSNPNVQNATYTVASVIGVSSYVWTLPAGVTNIIGQGTNSISFSYPSGFINGTISVSASNGCGSGGSRSLSVSRRLAATPSTIDVINTGSCPTRTYTYTLASMPSNATSVEWTVPAGGTILSGQGTSSITVSYTSNVISGEVKARSINNCSVSGYRSTTVKLSACPSSIVSNIGNKPIVALTTETLQAAVFPNPTASTFNLQLKGINSNKSVSVRVLDAQGRVVKSFRETAIGTIQFGNDLKAGVYMVEVKQGTAVTTTRVVKY